MVIQPAASEIIIPLDVINRIWLVIIFPVFFRKEMVHHSPYYAEKGDPLFEKLQSIIDNDLVLDDLKTDIVEVKLWDAQSSGAFPAVREECYIEVSSYGGDTTGYQIPFNVHYTGVKTKGTFNPTTKAFTAEA